MMHTITLAASKGGVGKTTLCSSLGAYAGEKHKVAIIDLDPQGSLTNWWNKRDSESPVLLEAPAGQLEQVIRQANADGFDYLLIDTPPAHMETIELAIKVADFVLVPCQPSPVDIEAIGDTLEIIESNGKKFAFVINRVISRTQIAKDAILMLANHGRIAGVPIAQRIAFATSMIDGRSAPEISGGKQATEELQKLWDFVLPNLK